MNTIGATTVFSGRDNSGEAAIVDSTYDDSFTQNLLTQISQDAIRKQQKKDKDLADRKKVMANMSYQFDPLGVEELDNEMIAGVDAYENWLTEQYAAGADPSDPTTEVGKEALRMKRALDVRKITGKAAASKYQAALAAGDEEGVDIAENTKWLEGYRAAKPTKEGETVTQAKSRYVDENPNYAKRATGLYDFVAPIGDKIEYQVNTRGDKSIDLKKAGELIDMYVITPEGQQKFKAMRPDGNYEAFKADQIKLIESMKPSQMGKVTSSKSSSSSSGGGDKLDYSFKVTRSNESNMWKADDPSINNGIVLSNKSGGELPLQDIKTSDGKVVNGTPIAITKNSNGDLFLEYSYKEENRLGTEVKKGYVPYAMFRDRIIEMYGEDISKNIGESATTESSKSEDKSKAEYKSKGGISFTVE